MPMCSMWLSLCSTLLSPLSTAVQRGSPLRMSASADMVPDLCRALQNGETPADLSAAISTTGGARLFFGSYFADDEWTCADAEQPPSALTNSLISAPPQILDLVLMNVVNAAATSSELTCARATKLVSALWEESWQLRTSTAALKAVVGAKLGDEGEVRWDQDYEYAKDEWAGILAFSPYSKEQLAQVRDALAGFEEPVALDEPE